MATTENREGKETKKETKKRKEPPVDEEKNEREPKRARTRYLQPGQRHVPRKRVQTKYYLDVMRYGGDEDYGAADIENEIGIEKARGLALEQGGSVDEWPVDDNGAPVLDDDAYHCSVSSRQFSTKKDRDRAYCAAKEIADELDNDPARATTAVPLKRDDNQPKIDEVLGSIVVTEDPARGGSNHQASVQWGAWIIETRNMTYETKEYYADVVPRLIGLTTSKETALQLAKQYAESRFKMALFSDARKRSYGIGWCTREMPPPSMKPFVDEVKWNDCSGYLTHYVPTRP